MAGCSQDPVVNRLPWVYRIDIQQGNVVDQDAVNQLRPGMSRRQVRFVMGTPMVADPFHADRWDYLYLFKPGSGGGEPEEKRVTVYFKNDKLVRLSGTQYPDLAAAEQTRQRQVTVTVPPQARGDVGILTRLWRWISFGKDPTAGHNH